MSGNIYQILGIQKLLGIKSGNKCGVANAHLANATKRGNY